MGLLENAHQQVDTLLHQGAGFEMAPPHLAGAVGEAEMQMHAFGAEGAVQGDHFQIALQHRGLRLAWALKGRTAEVAHHTQHKAAELLRPGQLLEAEA